MQAVAELLLKSTICPSLHSTRSLKQSVIAYKPHTLNSLWLLNARKDQAALENAGGIATGHPLLWPVIGSCLLFISLKG